jgi:transcriptional regulator with XRE-family HTH domain
VLIIFPGMPCTGLGSLARDGAGERGNVLALSPRAYDRRYSYRRKSHAIPLRSNDPGEASHVAVPEVTPPLTTFARQVAAHRDIRNGWSKAQLANRLGFDPSYVSQIENGRKPPTLGFAEKCDEVFDLPGTFVALYEDLQREVFPTWFAPIVPVERESVKISGWEPSAVPGLLQSDRYARALIRARRPQDDEETTERTVQARLDRQGVLTRPKPPMCWWVISEGVLRQVAGGPEVMGGQLDQLIKAAEAPGTVIQVLPFSAHDHAGTDGLLHLYERPGLPDVAYTECIGGGRMIQDPQEISDLTTMMGMLRAAALSRTDSVALMRTIRRDLG